MLLTVTKTNVMTVTRMKMAKTKKEPMKLLQALDFIALAQRDKGAPYQTHVGLVNGTAVATDGVLSAGVLIEESINAVPHTHTLVAALKKCDGPLQIAQLDSGRLSVKAGKFRALVPCLPGSQLPGVEPDPYAGVLDNRIRVGLEILSPFVVENSQRVVMASVLLRAYSMVATNGHVLLEYAHGIDLPPGLIVPKLFINALTRVKKNIVGFGFSNVSFTVFFEDNSWLKTQLYKEKWPDTDAIMQRPHSPVALPENFFEALHAVVGFSADNRVRFRPGKIQSHADADTGAQYEVEGITAKVTLNAKHLALLDGLAVSMDIAGNSGASYFHGENLRGAVSQFKED